MLLLGVVFFFGESLGLSTLLSMILGFPRCAFVDDFGVPQVCFFCPCVLMAPRAAAAHAVCAVPGTSEALSGPGAVLLPL